MRSNKQSTAKSDRSRSKKNTGARNTPNEKEESIQNSRAMQEEKPMRRLKKGQNAGNKKGKGNKNERESSESSDEKSGYGRFQMVDSKAPSGKTSENVKDAKQSDITKFMSTEGGKSKKGGNDKSQRSSQQTKEQMEKKKAQWKQRRDSDDDWNLGAVNLDDDDLDDEALDVDEDSDDEYLKKVSNIEKAKKAGSRF